MPRRGASNEYPLQGTSNEYPQHMFLWRNKKNINTFGLKKASGQELWVGYVQRFVALPGHYIMHVF